MGELDELSSMLDGLIGGEEDLVKPTPEKAQKPAKKAAKKKAKSAYKPRTKKPAKVKILIDKSKFLDLIREAHLAGDGNKSKEAFIKVLYRRGVKPIKGQAAAKDGYMIDYVLRFLEKVWKQCVHEVEDRG